MEALPIKQFCLAELKSRGWSAGLIGRLLGEPDRLAKNSRGKYPVKLWDVARVYQAETHTTFTSYQESREKRSKISAHSAEKQRACLINALHDYAEAHPITVPCMPIGTLYDRAIADWEDWQISRDRFDRDGWSADAATKQRWAVNYLRHVLSPYEEMLSTVGGKIGASNARMEIRRIVLNAIAVAYPLLAVECDRQFNSAKYDAG